MSALSSAGTPLVSVIVPCYNQARFIRAAWESLRAQSEPSWEAILINDGSSDDTQRVLADIAEQDSRARVVSQSNRGLAATRNRGLSLARGAFVQFLDADDTIAPEKFSIQLGKLTASGRDPAFCYCDYALGHEHDLSPLPWDHVPHRLASERPDLHFARDWETRLSIPIHAYLFDRRLFTEAGLQFDETLRNHEDFDIGLSILRRAPRIEYTEHCLAVYRHHPQSMTRDHRGMRDGFLQTLRKQEGLAAGDPLLAGVLRDKHREMSEYYAALIANDRARARALLLTRIEEAVGAALPKPLKRLIRRVQGRVS